MIDSAAKRASAIGLALSFLRTGIVPDGAGLSAPERLHADFLYSGIAAAALVPAPSVRRRARIASTCRKVEITSTCRKVEVALSRRVPARLGEGA